MDVNGVFVFNIEDVKKQFELSKARLVDETDFYIICLLEHGGEKSLSEIKEGLEEVKIKITKAAISMRIKRLKEKGVLVKFVPLSRLSKLGFSRDLLLMIQTEPGRDVDKIIDQISEVEGVKRMYKLLGEYDLLVELCCLGDEGLEKSLAEINCVSGLSRISKSPIQHRIKEHYHNLKEESHIEGEIVT